MGAERPGMSEVIRQHHANLPAHSFPSGEAELANREHRQSFSGSLLMASS